MAETQHETKVHGIVAEYSSVETLLAACRRIRDAGYTKIDAFTPFPVHGIDEALGIKATVLPWIALVGGIVGAISGMVMQIWMIGINYPYIISGKPFISLPAFVPISFELTILFASFCAFFGMWALNGLPKFSNPMFTSPRFDRATDDTFFLYIAADDERYDEAGVQQLLKDAGGEQIEKVVDDETSSTIPRNLIVTLAVIIALSLIPALVVANMRVATSESPRFHVFMDMDLSPSKDAQQTTTLFANDLAMRPEVPGTINRGEVVDLNLQTGIDLEALAQIDAQRAAQVERLVARYPQDQQAEEGTSADAAQGGDEQQQPAQTQPEQQLAPPKPQETGADGAPQGADAASASGQPAAAEDDTPWLQDNPLDLTSEDLRRGKEQFEIYCAACHGISGRGDGLVSQRAVRILAPTWVPPANLHDPSFSDQQYADGKLFNTISYGIRKMPGYASQIDLRDRWAVVGYVRALQQSQNASLELVPEKLREKIAAEQAEVQQKLKEAEQERQRQQEAEQANQSSP